MDTEKEKNLVPIVPNSAQKGGFSRQLSAYIREITGNGQSLVDFYMEILSGSICRTVDGVEILFKPRVGDMIAASDRLLERGFGKVIQDIELNIGEDSIISSAVSEKLNLLSTVDLERIAEGKGNIIDVPVQPQI